MPSILYTNEKPGEMPPSYYAATANASLSFPSLSERLSADLCIIGGGYAGLSAAIKARAHGLSVIVLDAHRVGWGASGRNGGQLGSGQRLEQGALEKMLGRDDAHKLFQLAQDANRLVRDLIAGHGIDCDLKDGVIHTDHKASYTDETRADVERLNADYGYEKISFLDRDAVRALVGTSAYYSGSLDLGAGHLHPLNFALGLARAASLAGAQIFERTEALAIERGAKAIVKTPQGEVCADHLLFACNGYLGRLDARTANRVMPINNYIIATEPLSETQAKSVIAKDYAVADSKYVINYFRFSSDRRLLFGGRESYRYRFPADIKSYVRQAMVKLFPQLSNTEIGYGWGGTLGITLNRMPHFERLAPNISTVGGFSGHGVAMATMAGSLAVDAIVCQPAHFDLMAKTPTPAFPGGANLRLPLLSLGMLYYSLRDRLG